MFKRLSLTLLLAACPAVSAFAHAHLVSSAPAAGSTVAPPASISLTFTEALEPHFSTVAVTDSAGNRLDLGNLSAEPDDDHTVSEQIKPLRAGTYTVTWEAVSVDTHRTTGTFTFHVQP